MDDLARMLVDKIERLQNMDSDTRRAVMDVVNVALTTARREGAEIVGAIIEWRDARETIFRAGEGVTPQMFTDLGHAEHKLMTLARALPTDQPKADAHERT